VVGPARSRPQNTNGCGIALSSGLDQVRADASRSRRRASRLSHAVRGAGLAALCVVALASGVVGSAAPASAATLGSVNVQAACNTPYHMMTNVRILGVFESPLRT
jgi:hypothetical protein